jgi:hypothetical protein
LKPETDITEEPPKNETQRHSAEQGTCLSGTVKERAADSRRTYYKKERYRRALQNTTIWRKRNEQKKPQFSSEQWTGLDCRCRRYSDPDRKDWEDC